MKNIRKVLSIALICTLLLSILASCTPTAEPTPLVLNDGTLTEATVGVEYYADLNEFAEGDGIITFKLKDGEELPVGLTLSPAGVLSGIPEKSDRRVKFTVIATAGEMTAEAEYEIRVNKGAITYDDSEIRVVVGKDSTYSIATAKNGVNVKYSIDDGELPEGLTLNPDGTISGTPTNLGEEKTVIVEAEAEDCDSDTATIIIRVTNPLITFDDITAPIATAGQYYTAFIGNAHTSEGENIAITYGLVPGQPLPSGLRITPEGLIYGTPTEHVVRHKGQVRASANGYEAEISEVTITVRSADDVSKTAGYISFEGGTLPNATAGSLYCLLSGDAENTLVNAKATNRNVISYSLAEGSRLPQGMTLYANGTVFGTPRNSGSYTFDIVASAENCATSVIKTFTLEVVNPKIPYGPTLTTEAGEVGKSFEANIATAAPVEGVKVEYVLAPGAKLPEGLTLSLDGIISGTPTKPYNRKGVKILVQEVIPEGGAPVYGGAGSCDVYITINSAMTAVTDGKLEAEYIDFTGKRGGGYSGSADGVNMIQAAGVLDVSNGYYVSYLHGEISLEFHFVSSVTEETQVGFVMSLASEIQPSPATFTPDQMTVSVNGQSHDYGSITLECGPAGSMSAFAEYDLGTITIKPGENLIVITIQSNTLLQGSRTGGPALDYIKLDTDTISWRPYEYNLNNL